jgi:serine/threonine protein kinase
MSLSALTMSLADRYRIEREVGQGGMATVYLAEDVRHHRKVAIKVLHPELSAVLGPDRFLKEIELTASLQHPHILPLFDSGNAGGLLFYVMPFVDGETLRSRLEREHQLPITDALRITTEVADALEYAHKRKVIHRDIKPENILLHDGRPLVADFGIALAVQHASGSRMTQTGMSLGTPQYMAPEQAMGDKGVDARADIYALGVVTYEMLTGAPPFVAPTAQAIVAKVMTEDPRPLIAQRRSIPPGVESAVLTALEKLPADRFATAADFARALTSSPSVTSTRPAPGIASPRFRAFSILPGVLILVLGLGVGIAASRQWPARSPFASQWEGQLLGGALVAISPYPSPDGQSIAFAAMVNGQTQLALLKPGSGDWTVLTHDTTMGLTNQFAWSLDGSRIYFDRFYEAPRGVYSISALGGEARLVLPDANSPEMLPDGSLLVVRVTGDRLARLYRFWPETQRLDSLNAFSRTTFQTFARAFPDGREVAFLGTTDSDTAAASHVYALDLTSGRVRRLAEPLDDSRSSVNGTPTLGASGFLATTADGRWLLMDYPQRSLHRIVAIPRDGSRNIRTLFTFTHRIQGGLTTGPDGSIYLDVTNRTNELVRYPHAGPLERTMVPPMSGPPVPLTDGRVLVASASGGRDRVMAISPGKEAVPFVYTEEETTWPMSRLGSDRVVLRIGSPGHRTVAIVSATTGSVIRRLEGVSADAVAGSPDGKTVYVVQNGFVLAVPSEGGVARVVRKGDGIAVDPHGRYLVINVNAADRVRLFQVPLDGQPEVEVPWHSPLHLAPLTLAPNAVGPDGRIAVVVVLPSRWFFPGAILDPVSGEATLIPESLDRDLSFPGWADDGSIVAVSAPLEASLWRFRPVRGGSQP